MSLGLYFFGCSARRFLVRAAFCVIWSLGSGYDSWFMNLDSRSLSENMAGKELFWSQGFEVIDVLTL